MATALFAAAPVVEGRRITGLGLPWGTAASDRPIQFAPNSLTWDDDAVVLRLMHDAATEPPLARLGATMTIEATDDGLVVAATLPETTRANDALELIRAGVIDSLSAEVAITSTDDSTRPPTVRSGFLTAFALVPVGAFDDAKLFEKRQAEARARRLRIAALS